jgi:hypothetical protein
MTNAARGPAPTRLRAPMLVAVASSAVILFGLLAALVTWAFQPTTPTPCRLDCRPPGPRAGATLPFSREHTYQSQLGFAFDYPDNWSTQDKSAAPDLRGVFLQSNSAWIYVLAGREVAVADAIALAPDLWQDRVPDLAELDEPPLRLVHGAHIGSARGQGLVLGGTFVPESGAGTSAIVRVGVLAARRDGVTVLLTGLAPFDPDDLEQGGRGFSSSAIDYLATEFRWRGER